MTRSDLAATQRADTGPRLSAHPGDLRQRNFSAILRTLLHEGPMARAELSRALGLASGTVTKLTTELVAAGLLVELPAASGQRTVGRPRLPVAIDEHKFRVVGVHIGLHRTIVGLVGLKGGVVAERELVHRDRAPESVVSQLITALGALIGDSADAVLGIGVSLGGVIDRETNVVLELASLDWRDVPLGDRLTEAFGLPVVIDSTVRALVHAESTFGRGRSTKSFLQVFVGNIVGGVFVLEGKPHIGPDGADGDLTHLPTGSPSTHVCSCGRTDCLQAAASDEAVVADARSLGLISPDARYGDLVKASLNGNERALELLQARGDRVGAAISLLIEVFDPHLVVLAGGVIEGPAMLTHVRAAVGRHVRRPLAIRPEELVVATSFGTEAPMFASAALMLGEFYLAPPTQMRPPARDGVMPKFRGSVTDAS